MKCPKCKKPSELQTKRTKANGKEVVRERYCPKCKNRFITIERFDTDIAESDSKAERRISQLERDGSVLKDRIKNYENIFRNFKTVMDRVSKDKY